MRQGGLHYDAAYTWRFYGTHVELRKVIDPKGRPSEASMNGTKVTDRSALQIQERRLDGFTFVNGFINYSLSLYSRKKLFPRVMS